VSAGTAAAPRVTLRVGSEAARVAHVDALGAAVRVEVDPSLAPDVGVIGAEDHPPLEVSLASVRPLMAMLLAAANKADAAAAQAATAQQLMQRLLAERGEATMARLEEHKRQAVAAAKADQRDSAGEVLRHGLWRERCEFELTRCASTGGAIGVVLIDLDGFGAYNDRVGYAAGDAALRQVARMLPLALRGVGPRPPVLGRDAADAFGVLMPGADVPTTARVAERIRDAIQQAPTSGGRVTATIAVTAGVPARDVRARALLAALDAAARPTRRRGGNDVVVLESFAAALAMPAGSP
jgi:diguanylate cyclase (GGDEF)-like protein